MIRPNYIFIILSVMLLLVPVTVDARPSPQNSPTKQRPTQKASDSAQRNRARPSRSPAQYRAPRGILKESSFKAANRRDAGKKINRVAPKKSVSFAITGDKPKSILKTRKSSNSNKTVSFRSGTSSSVPPPPPAPPGKPIPPEKPSKPIPPEPPSRTQAGTFPPTNPRPQAGRFEPINPRPQAGRFEPINTRPQAGNFDPVQPKTTSETRTSQRPGSELRVVGQNSLRGAVDSAGVPREKVVLDGPTANNTLNNAATRFPLNPDTGKRELPKERN